MSSLLDYLAGVGLLIMTLIAGWVKGISSKVANHETRLAVQEQQVGAIPKLLEGIKDEIKGMRSDAKESQRELYKHIDDFRKEVKHDLASKQDKPG